MSWKQISLNTREDLAEQVSDLFSEVGALTITLQAADDEEIFEPPIGETIVWKKTKVIALFDEEVQFEEIRNQVNQALQAQEQFLSDWLEEAVADQAWERAWLEHFKPMQFGKNLWVVPSSYDPPDPNATNIRLDPGLAFGTGTHATTALCLKWLANQELLNKQVLDFGCGSGILAVAAAKLGAASVNAVDIDPQALTATRDNATSNGVLEKIECYLPHQHSAQQYDIVLANILAGPLMELADTIGEYVKPSGELILSGILPEQAESVVSAYHAKFDFEPAVIEDGWVRLYGQKR